MRRAAGWEQTFFRVESMRVITDETARLGVHHRGHREGVGGRPAGRRSGRASRAHAEGNGPVNAIDSALRAALGSAYPELAKRAPHRLQGAHPRRGHGHWRDHARAHRRERRRAHLDDHRRQRRTSSRRRGGRSRRASCTDCCTPRPECRGPDELHRGSSRFGARNWAALWPLPQFSPCSPPSTTRAATTSPPRRARARGCPTGRREIVRASSPWVERLGHQGPDQGFATEDRPVVRGQASGPAAG